MTLPKEIRNIIYKFVLCDDVDHVHEPIKYGWAGTVVAHVPTRVHLHESLPSSHQTIMVCRELYSEMKEMYAAAYRAYWSENHFIYDVGSSVPARSFPADREIQHIQEFSLSLPYLQDFYLHVIFEGGEWDSWLLPTDGKTLESSDTIAWVWCQGVFKGAVTKYMGAIATTRDPLDPRVGRGFIRNMLGDASNSRDIIEKFQYMHQWVDPRDFLNRHR